MASHTWQKSSYSGANNDCIEVRAASGLVELRESDDPGVIVRPPLFAFTGLLNSIKAGEFDRWE
ncbi:DUF397 domain-containing protein [Kitasatospora sp. NPDC058032]|uniref:DUF397 domain-containing protein n=1 Tax=Kitasatospora sp. NPDC058032 TaxID=3346307 RepID=UPI0036D778A9